MFLALLDFRLLCVFIIVKEMQCFKLCIVFHR